MANDPPAPPIESLPNETIFLILEFYMASLKPDAFTLDPEERVYGHSMFSRLGALYVCRLWRVMLLKEPRFWRNLLVMFQLDAADEGPGVGMKSNVQLVKLGRRLHLAQGQPMNLCFTLLGRSSKAGAPLIERELRRVFRESGASFESIHEEGRRRGIMLKMLPKLMGHQIASLTNLTLRDLWTQRGTVVESETTITLPSLEALYLDWYYMDPISMLRSFVCPRLRTLMLHHTSYKSLIQFLICLHKFPTLTDLFSTIPFTNIQDGLPLPQGHPNVSHLVMKSQFFWLGDPLADIAANVFPNLSAITVDIEELRKLVSNPGAPYLSNIRSLHISRCYKSGDYAKESYFVDTWRTVCRCMPNIQRLTLGMVNDISFETPPLRRCLAELGGFNLGGRDFSLLVSALIPPKDKLIEMFFKGLESLRIELELDSKALNILLLFLRSRYLHSLEAICMACKVTFSRCTFQDGRLTARRIKECINDMEDIAYPDFVDCAFIREKKVNDFTDQATTSPTGLLSPFYPM